MNEFHYENRIIYMKRLLIGFLFLSLTTLVVAQKHDHAHVNPTAFKTIDARVSEGVLSKAEALRLKFTLVFDEENAPTDLRSQMSVLKCAMPLQVEANKALKAQTIDVAEYNALNKMLESPENTTESSGTYTTPSGKFIIDWSTVGTNAIPATDDNNNGIPDYVEWTAFAADSTYRHYTNNLGYSDWIGSSKYRIEYTDQRLYGFCQPISATQTKIAIHRNFINGFPGNTHPEGNVIGAVYVTVGHELKHAIQYFYTGWANESSDWLELDATIYEDVSFDDVNDYFNYNRSSESIFNNSSNGFYPGNYYQAPWGLYFLQVYQDDFFRIVWDKLRANRSKFYLTAIAETVNQLGGNVQEDFTRVMLWHVASGNPNIFSNPGRQIDGYGFEEGLAYPTAIVSSENSVSNKFTSYATLKPTASHFAVLSPTQSDTGRVVIEMEYDNGVTDLGIGLALEMKDGTAVESVRMASSSSSKITYAFEQRWEDIKSVNIAIANTTANVQLDSFGNLDVSQTYRFRYRVGNDIEMLVSNEDNEVIPSGIVLKQNFPNPFNPSTTVRFNLPESAHIQLSVFDMTGRLVQTLANGTYASGEHSVIFDAQNLPSGTYLYRLQSANYSMTKKLTLTK